MTDVPAAESAEMTDATPGVRVELRGVRRAFATGVVAVDSLDLVVPAGQFLAILGPSGCGKSTLLRIVAGLDTPTSGTIRVGDDAGLLHRRQRTAYVFQDAHLLSWRTVLRNVELPLELNRTPRHLHRDAARVVLDQVGLGDALERYPSQLSGGMRMRVSLARALVTDPDLLLLDEPFAALDEITRHRLDEQLRQLWLDRRMTTIFVTHSTEEASFLAERAVVLSQRPARVVLDHELGLPRHRSADLRAEPGFAREMGVLFHALEGR
jgi:NitT/TauT family transport system ATP-binding protein